jgi:hypothetical protein
MGQQPDPTQSAPAPHVCASAGVMDLDMTTHATGRPPDARAAWRTPTALLHEIPDTKGGVPYGRRIIKCPACRTCQVVPGSSAARGRAA